MIGLKRNFKKEKYRILPISKSNMKTIFNLISFADKYFGLCFNYYLSIYID